MSLEAFIERQNGAAWDIIGQALVDDFDPARITAAGSVGFGGYIGDNYAYDNFASIDASTGGGDNPIPVLTGISPNQAIEGSPAFTLTVTGSSFIQESVVRWNGADRPTTYVSPTQLLASIPASDVAAAGTANVTVLNPAPGGGSSLPAVFTIESGGPTQNPAPVLDSVAPQSATAGGGPVAMTLNGSDFSAASIVRLNGVDQPTTFVSANVLQATIAASNLAQAGIAAMTVYTPGPGGGTSTPDNFFVLETGDALFYDNYNRADSADLGNNWTEKTPNVFSIEDGALTSIDTSFVLDYRDSIVYRPQAEDALEIEVGTEFIRLPQLVNGNFPQLHARVQRDTVTLPASLNSYIFFVNDYAPSPGELVIAAQGVVEGECYIATFPLQSALQTGQRYRLRFRVSGTNPVALVGFLDQFDGQSWQTLATGATTHDASTQPVPGLYCESTPTRPAAMPAPIVGAGTVGFAKWWARADNYDNFYAIGSGAGGNPLPAITGLSPTTITAGSPGFTLTVNGSG
ncbi:MAG: IPT/TIG domain-containing protein, partial [Gammaproteobacteria bacterium]|nr:IPT/TIG domain-containing protein [Gammaproteobacteria bacterium]